MNRTDQEVKRVSPEMLAADVQGIVAEVATSRRAVDEAAAQKLHLAYQTITPAAPVSAQVYQEMPQLVPSPQPNTEITGLAEPFDAAANEAYINGLANANQAHSEAANPYRYGYDDGYLPVQTIAGPEVMPQGLTVPMQVVPESPEVVAWRAAQEAQLTAARQDLHMLHNEQENNQHA